MNSKEIPTKEHYAVLFFSKGSAYDSYQQLEHYETVSYHSFDDVEKMTNFVASQLKYSTNPDIRILKVQPMTYTQTTTVSLS